jgi:putative ABC transport system permease protein
MRIHPMLSAMRHNKVGVILVALQMSLTIAILCNALFLIHQRLHNSSRPSGVDEDNLVIVSSEWIGNPPDIKSLQMADLAMLRQLPGVVDAYAANSFPLSGGGWGCTVRLVQEQTSPSALCSDYLVDEHARKTLGVRLTAGRWFTASDVVDRRGDDATPLSNAAIVTRALSEKLFPDGTALGKTIYIDRVAQTIVGVIERLQGSYVSSGASDKIEYSVLQPNRYIDRVNRYVIHTRPGEIDTVMAAAPQELRKLNNARVMHYARTFAEVRARAYRGDLGFAGILATVCAILVAVTAFGIVGLTSSWVTQRRRQIGIRRALGATRRAILQQFQIENLIIAIAASIIGGGLAIALNLWMVSRFEMQRMPLLAVIAAAFAVLGLGQAAVLWPALRASSVPPALATRAA